MKLPSSDLSSFKRCLLYCMKSSVSKNLSVTVLYGKVNLRNKAVFITVTGYSVLLRSLPRILIFRSKIQITDNFFLKKYRPEQDIWNLHSLTLYM